MRLSAFAILFTTLLACSNGPPASAKSDAALEPNVNRPGGDFKDFDLDKDDPAACQRACADAPECKAFTYVKPGVQGEKARCWLKDSVPEKSAEDCCVSGVK